MVLWEILWSLPSLIYFNDVFVVKIGFVKFEGFSGVLFAIKTDWFL